MIIFTNINKEAINLQYFERIYIKKEKDCYILSVIINGISYMLFKYKDKEKAKDVITYIAELSTEVRAASKIFAFDKNGSLLEIEKRNITDC